MIKKFRIWNHQLKTFWYGGLREIYGHLPNDVPDNQIQQWTGLTDSQGVEIYEGDILEFLGPEDFSAHYGKVFFEDGMFKATEHGTLYSWRKWITVVGDIFQNPELLEKS